MKSPKVFANDTLTVVIGPDNSVKVYAGQHEIKLFKQIKIDVNKSISVDFKYENQHLEAESETRILSTLKFIKVKR